MTKLEPVGPARQASVEVRIRALKVDGIHARIWNIALPALVEVSSPCWCQADRRSTPRPKAHLPEWRY